MTDKHKPTPGPLTIATARNGSGDLGIVGSGNLVIAECFADIRRAHEDARDEAMANARQFVLAPRMLALLELMFERDCCVYAHELTIPMRTHADAAALLVKARALLREARDGS